MICLQLTIPFTGSWYGSGIAVVAALGLKVETPGLHGLHKLCCIVVSTLFGVYDVIVTRYYNLKMTNKGNLSKAAKKLGQIFIKNTIWTISRLSRS